VKRRMLFDPAAEFELREAADFYDLESPGLGGVFLDAVESSLRALLEFPQSGSILADGQRKLVLEGFPYYIVYWTDGVVIEIYAVAHERRRPGYWHDQS